MPDAKTNSYPSSVVLMCSEVALHKKLDVVHTVMTSNTAAKSERTIL